MIMQSPVTTFSTKSGAMVWTRPLQANDTPFLIDIFDHMSSESRYQRFHQTLDHLTEQRIQQEAAKIAEANLATNFGLIAFVTSSSQIIVPVGVARWVEVSANEAEIAISIRDDYQNQGIGSQMLHLLIDQAKQVGYKCLSAEIQNTNAPIWHILTNLPYPIAQNPQGNESIMTIYLE